MDIEMGVVTFLKMRCAGSTAQADTSGGGSSFLSDGTKPVESAFGVVCISHKRMPCDFGGESHADQTGHRVITVDHACYAMRCIQTRAAAK